MKALLALLLPFAFASPLRAENAEWQPPFITTPDEVVERMLEMAGTSAGDTVVDLGSGDGRIVIAAARRFGARGLGIELDARLVEASRQNAKRAGVSDRVSFVQGDVLAADLSPASVVTVYLLPSLMGQLQSRFVYELRPGTRIVSHSFGLAGWKPDRSETLRLTKPHAGQGDESTLHLWIVPADVRGVWRGGGRSVRIEQSFQQIEVEGATQGRLRGAAIEWTAAGETFRGRVEGNRIAGELAGAGGRRPLVLTR